MGTHNFSGSRCRSQRCLLGTKWYAGRYIQKRLFSTTSSCSKVCNRRQRQQRQNLGVEQSVGELPECCHPAQWTQRLGKRCLLVANVAFEKLYRQCQPRQDHQDLDKRQPGRSYSVDSSEDLEFRCSPLASQLESERKHTRRQWWRQQGHAVEGRPSWGVADAARGNRMRTSVWGTGLTSRDTRGDLGSPPFSNVTSALPTTGRAHRDTNAGICHGDKRAPIPAGDCRLTPGTPSNMTMMTSYTSPCCRVKVRTLQIRRARLEDPVTNMGMLLSAVMADKTAMTRLATEVEEYA